MSGIIITLPPPADLDIPDMLPPDVPEDPISIPIPIPIDFDIDSEEAALPIPIMPMPRLGRCV